MYSLALISKKKSVSPFISVEVSLSSPCPFSYFNHPFVGRKNARRTGKIMKKPNVVISYGFAGRCFHAYLVGLTSDQIQRDLRVVSPTCQPAAHA